jgi:hypothetical protein
VVSNKGKRGLKEDGHANINAVLTVESQEVSLKNNTVNMVEKYNNSLILYESIYY